MLADVLFILCLLTVAVGAGLIFLPAGLIVGGGLGAWALLRAERAVPPAEEV